MASNDNSYLPKLKSVVKTKNNNKDFDPNNCDKDANNNRTVKEHDSYSQQRRDHDPTDPLNLNNIQVPYSPKVIVRNLHSPSDSIHTEAEGTEINDEEAPPRSPSPIDGYVSDDFIDEDNKGHEPHKSENKNCLIPRRFANASAEVLELSESQKFLRDALDGLSDNNRDILDSLYDPTTLEALPTPLADGPIVKTLKWAEANMFMYPYKSMEKGKIEDTIYEISKRGPKGLAYDLRLQDEYRRYANILGPYCAILDYLVSSDDLDPNKILEMCRDGLEMGADNLNKIQNKRRYNIVTRDDVMSSELKSLIKQKENFSLRDESKYVFGSKFLNIQTQEMNASHKFIQSKNSLAQQKIKENNLKKGGFKYPVVKRLAPPRNLKIDVKKLNQSTHKRNVGYYGSSHERGYYNRSSGATSTVTSDKDQKEKKSCNRKPQNKGQGYVYNHSLANMEVLLKSLNLPLNAIDPFQIKNFLFVAHLGARLEKFSANWEKITHDSSIIDIISGHKIGFFEKPKQCNSWKNGILNEKQIDHIKNLLNDKVIEPAFEEGIVSPIFFRCKTNGSLRMILDLKCVNMSIKYYHFKMMSLGDVKNIMMKNDYFVTIDIKSAYDSLPIHVEDRKFLQFEANNQLFQFRGWPNGLAEAPRLFTLVLKPVISILEKLGIKCVIFIDDLLLMQQCKQELLNQAAFVVKLLTWLGFIVSKEKSNFSPSQVTTYLGMVIDSVNMQLRLPDKKVEELLNLCDKYLSNTVLDARKLASLVGKMQFASQAVEMGPFHLRNLQRSLASTINNGGWDQKLVISNPDKQDLIWWKNNLTSENRAPIVKSKETPVVRMSSDASLQGWGAHCEGETAQGKWSKAQTQEHINVLELTAALFGLKALIKNRNLSVILEMDNIPAIAYIAKKGGTKNIKMSHIAQEIWQWCRSMQIILTPVHIPGVNNQIADHLSRNFADASDWKLNKKAFKLLKTKRGPLKIDLFASDWNTQLPEFYSWKKSPNAKGVDALSLPWPEKNSYAFPPFSLINVVLRKIRETRVTVLILTPVWTAANWYSSLLLMSCMDPILLPNSEKLLINHEDQTHPLIRANRLRLAGWMVSGERCRVMEYQKGLQTLSDFNIDKQLTFLTTTAGQNTVAGVVKNKLIRFLAPLH